MYYEFYSPPVWLNAVAHDPRITVGEYTYFSRHMSIGLWSPEERVEIGKFCSIAKDVVIFGGGEHILSYATTFPFKWMSASFGADDRHKDDYTKGPTTIANDVWIGYGATILSGVKIGNGAVIGAQAVVTKNVPDYAIVAGNPAKIIRHRFQPETIDRLLALRWWEWDLPKIYANLDLLYQNPDTWPEELNIKEPQGKIPKLLDRGDYPTFASPSDEV